MAFIARWRRFRPRRSFVPGTIGTIISATMASAGVASASFTGVGIVSGVLTSAGAATDSSTGGSIATATLTSAGVGGASLVGAGVHSGTLSSAGTGTASFAGSTFTIAVMTAAGTVNMAIRADLQQVISRHMLQDPVDCVLAGDQKDFKKGFAPYHALRGIFRE